jgi:hypothetical protein
LGPPLAIEVDSGIDDRGWLRQADDATDGESMPANGREEAA